MTPRVVGGRCRSAACQWMDQVPCPDVPSLLFRKKVWVWSWVVFNDVSEGGDHSNSRHDSGAKIDYVSNLTFDSGRTTSSSHHGLG